MSACVIKMPSYPFQRHYCSVVGSKTFQLLKALNLKNVRCEENDMTKRYRANLMQQTRETKCIWASCISYDVLLLYKKTQIIHSFIKRTVVTDQI